jgi:flagellar biosynthesis/type III secretory pathway M-ring protein FliF/YscJ
MLAATAHHRAAFIAVFTVFVVLCLVLIFFVIRFAVKLDRTGKAAAKAAAAAASRQARRRRRPPQV